MPFQGDVMVIGGGDMDMFDGEPEDQEDLSHSNSHLRMELDEDDGDNSENGIDSKLPLKTRLPTLSPAKALNFGQVTASFSNASPSTSRIEVVLRSSPAPPLRTPLFDSGSEHRDPSSKSRRKRAQEISIDSETSEAMTPLEGQNGLTKKKSGRSKGPRPSMKFAEAHETPIDSEGSAVMTPQPGQNGLSQKKRGRPKGWKAGVTFAEARRETPVRKDAVKKVKAVTSGTPGTEMKKRGRPPKQPEPTLRERFINSQPKYMPFLCEWHDSHGAQCPAELQNMETLRKHVFLIHPGMDPLICRWGKCAKLKSPLEFKDEQDLQRHVEKKHFRSFVWHMGDGVQNKGMSTLKQDPNQLPAYLFDENGNQVTPSVKNQQIEDVKATTERKRRLNKFLEEANDKAVDEKVFRLQTLYGSALTPKMLAAELKKAEQAE